MAKHLRKYPVCTNCEYAFTKEQPDNFCPKCGQENHDLNVPFQHVALELLEGTIHYDSKFWVTLKYLLFAPGKLTNEFHRGRRMGYVPPIRLYVFISFVFFFLLSLRVGHVEGGERSLGSQLRKAPLQVNSLITKAAPQAPDSIRNIIRERLEEKNLNMDSLLVADTPAEQYNFSTLDSIPAHASTAQLDSALNTFNVKSHNWFTRGLLQKTAEFQRLSKNELIAKGLKYISLMMFVLMPVFALLLKLVFFRARRFYMEHLIFSIHLHCFYFVLYILYMLSLYLFTSIDLFGWANLLGFLYLFFGLRRVFKRGYLRTFFNMATLLFFYLIAGVTTLLLGMVVSLAI
ncbi:DUF3667 domain-containing protein [Rufibacter latericius]|uniref:DUF3667 domain-containing protein n=1 Tax=Rufibacter latericius TaxID=2487040 RepID=A0A3M9MER3_9BACT|nr:DUF3667 domain-containing protein [Rufibacter latericius]RNI23617.1 DUF3667 domain-containing protein [Rufibacter latericius]